MIVAEGIHRTFRTQHGSVEAVKPLDLVVRPGSLLTLLGPSGCGKSTTLRMLAGLERPDGGRITIGGRVVYDGAHGTEVPPNHRNIGFVFQSYALWPHLSVFENVAYALRVRRVGRREIRGRVERALDQVGLHATSQRRTAQLSGGQQQRVALARALVAEPSLLLLDEPFSSLDAQLRLQMGEELIALQRRLGVTTVYVTHDQSEALALSDEIVVMDGGRVVQRGAPPELYERPQTRFVAQFLGRTNLLEGRATAPLSVGTHLLDTPLGPLRVEVQSDRATTRRSGLVAIRPEAITILSLDATNPASSTANVFRGRIERRVFRGEWFDCHVRVHHQSLLVRAPVDRAPAEGAAVDLEVTPERCTLLMDETVGTGGPVAAPALRAATPT